MPTYNNIIHVLRKKSIPLRGNPPRRVSCRGGLCAYRSGDRAALGRAMPAAGLVRAEGAC
jgi:hypothetical protein